MLIPRTFLIAIILLFASCTNQTKTQLATKQPKKEVTEQTGDFTPGMWRVDSVAEDNLIKDRLIDKTPKQVFNYEKNSHFSVMEVTEKMTKSSQIGTWKAENDSLFVYSEQGHLAMRFGYSINGNKLTLKGNFPISEYNTKKPVFYLSKYVEKRL